jgi:hypothetical protein
MLVFSLSGVVDYEPPLLLKSQETFVLVFAIPELT